MEWLSERSRVMLFLIVLFLPILLLVACSNETDSNPSGEGDTAETEVDNTVGENTNQEENAEPVTIQIAMASEETFHNRFDYIAEKLPNIELEYVPYNGNADQLEELFASGVYPDIINQPFFNMRVLFEYDLVEPLDDLIEKHGFDLDSLRPSSLAYVRGLGQGEIIGIPDGASHVALYYNKEIFDLFGEPYPDPNIPMTWEETFELAERLTGERNGVEYLGFQFHGGGTSSAAVYPLRQYALNFTDPETGEVIIEDDPNIREYFDKMDRYFSIPGVAELDAEGNLFPEQRAA